MKTLMMKIVSALAFCGMFGCVSQDSKPRPDWFDKRMSIVEAIESLVTDPMFTEMYAEAQEHAKKHGNVRPVLTILPIENNIKGDKRGDSATYQMYKRLQAAIRKKGKFTIVDPEKRAIMIKTVLKEPDDGVNSTARGIQFYGEYDPSDFVMTGELVREETGELSLNLDMINTRNGTVFWNAVVTPSDSFRR